MSTRVVLHLELIGNMITGGAAFIGHAVRESAQLLGEWWP
jgi:hypothetical protein